jgi:hypothetical protein
LLACLDFWLIDLRGLFALGNYYYFTSYILNGLSSSLFPLPLIHSLSNLVIQSGSIKQTIKHITEREDEKAKKIPIF